MTDILPMIRVRPTLGFATAVVAATVNFGSMAQRPIGYDDDARFRLKGELNRLDAARDNARIDRERFLDRNPPSASGPPREPFRFLDRLRSDHRSFDRIRELEVEAGRRRADRARLDRERASAEQCHP